MPEIIQLWKIYIMPKKKGRRDVQQKEIGTMTENEKPSNDTRKNGTLVNE